ncbi:MAG: hypothetical protein P1U89_25540 [Verrucomicrobiales bacterium]|nr:hypothetical protein [Verrucomicrobiales bacterium]
MTRKENLNALFADDSRTVILPIDHGTAIPVPGLDRPAELIGSISDSVDGFVVNLGVAIAAKDEFAGKGICLRTDVYKPPYGTNDDLGAYRIYGADEAEAAGAHAMMNMLYPHHPNEAESFREAAELISESLHADIPAIIESLPFGLGKVDDYTVENISFAVRAAAELGADVVKTAFPTGAGGDDFKAIVDAAIVPVILLGGAAMGDDEALLTMVKTGIDAGASGIAVGRNVWQHPDPCAIARALHAVVHDDASVSSAMKLL